MTPEEFCVWMQGYIDGNGVNIMTTAQVKEIRRKLNEVDYAPMMEFETGEDGEIFHSDNGQMFAIWNCDTTCNYPVEQFNVDYTER